MGIETILAMVLSAFVPVVMDGAKMGLSKLFGYSTGDPKSFDDFYRLRELDIRKIEAMGRLDAPYGNISPWVADLRASSRYIAVLAVIGSFIVYSFIHSEPLATQTGLVLAQLAGSAVFFLFGDRVYLGLKQSK